MAEPQRLPPALIALFIGLLLVVPLLALSVVSIEGPRIRAEALADLNAIGRLKAEQIGGWLDERRNNAESLMASPSFVADAQRWLQHRDTLAETRMAAHQALLLRTHGYRLELAHSRDLADSPSLAKALATGQPQFRALYRDATGLVWLDMLLPLREPGPRGGRPLGVALLRSMAGDFLFPFIRSWPTHSPSAETLLVRQDGDHVLFLNALRHRKDGPLSLRLPLDSPDLPAAMAVRGPSPATLEGRDYRGVPVLAVSHPVPGTDWVLVAKLDRDEVFNPLYTLVTWVAVVALLAVLLAFVFLHRLWRQHLHAQHLQQRASQDEALRASEAHFRLLASATFEGIALTRQGRFVDANQQLLDMIGYPREELIGKAVADLLPEVDRERVLDNILNNRESRIEHAMICKDGHLIQIEAHGKPVQGDAPDLRITALRDVSERQAAEAALRFQLDLNRGITEKSTDSIFINDAEGRVTAVNPEAERTFGYPAAELLGRRLHDVIHHRHDDGRHFPMDECPLCDVYVTGEAVRDHETTVYRRDGTPLVVTMSNAALESGGRVVGAALVVHDITGIRQAEQSLRDREDDLNRAQAVGHIGSWRLDVRRNLLTWSRENHRIFGIPEGTPLTYETFLSCVHPDDRERVDQAWQDGLQGLPYDVEHRLLVGAEVIWVREKAELEIDERGNLLGGFGTTQDISGRKAAEQALEAARVSAIKEKNLLETVMQALPVGLAIVDARGGCVRHNADYDRIWRGPRPEVRQVADYIDFKAWWVDSGEPVQPEEWASAQALRSGEPVPNQMLRIQRFDGSCAFVLNSAAPIRDAHGEIIGSAVVIQDITELKQAEQALRDSDERFQLATEIGRSGTWDWNVMTDEVIWSRGHFEILGYAPGEVTASYQAWLERVHPDDQTPIANQIQRCMRERTDYIAEFRVIWPDSTLHWMSARGRYFYDADGSCLRMLGAMADITSFKLAEQALREADQRKDEFLAMLAHELRNPLAPIRNAAHVLGRLDLNEPRLVWAKDIIENQVSHLTRLVDELLDVSRIARGKVSLHKAPIDLADLLRQARDSVQPLMNARGHRFVVHMPMPGIVFEGDMVRLIQVLQNLLNNAAKYTPDGGQIELSAGVLGGQLEFQVHDNGMGIPADLLPGVFDLFRQGERTLDRAQGGLGLGLNLVQRLVELHDGRVEARSPGPGQGSTFTVRLPVGMPVPPPTSTAPAQGMGDDAPALRILLVDDDPAVAESMIVFLEVAGYQVRGASSGSEALDLIGTFRPAVVLLDIGLPGQSGYDVARQIRQQGAGRNMVLVAVTGYGHEEAVALGRSAGFDHHLVKPVDPDILEALLAGLAAGLGEAGQG